LTETILLAQPLAALRQLAVARGVSTADCFEKRDLVDKLLRAKSHDAAASRAAPAGSAASAEATGSPSSGGSSPPHGGPKKGADSKGDAADLGALSVGDLRALINEAGLSAVGLLEKPEFVARAREARAKLAARPKLPPDAARYEALGVRFFGRLSCPHCVTALKDLAARGLPRDTVNAACGDP
jgi:hypothetical protein